MEKVMIHPSNCVSTLYSDKPYLSRSSFVWQKNADVRCHTHPCRFLIPIIDGCHQRTKGEEVLPQKNRGHPTKPPLQRPRPMILWLVAKSCTSWWLIPIFFGFQRVSTILLVVQDFATIHNMEVSWNGGTPQFSWVMTPVRRQVLRGQLTKELQGHVALSGLCAWESVPVAMQQLRNKVGGSCHLDPLDQWPSFRNFKGISPSSVEKAQ